jgi:hypothetical protein
MDRISRFSKIEHWLSPFSWTATSTIARFVTLLEVWRCIFALELNHLNQSQIWREPCLLHEQWHGNSKWRL